MPLETGRNPARVRLIRLGKPKYNLSTKDRMYLVARYPKQVDSPIVCNILLAIACPVMRPVDAHPQHTRRHAQQQR